MPPAASASVRSSTARRRRPRLRAADRGATKRLVGVQGVVQFQGLALAGESLHRARGGVAAEQQVGDAGKLGSLDDPGGVLAHLVLGARYADAGARRNVEAGF